MEGEYLQIYYAEDVSRLLRCCERTATKLMKETGRAFKIGRRWAISTETFNGIINGKF